MEGIAEEGPLCEGHFEHGVALREGVGLGGEGNVGFRDGWKGVRVAGAKVDDVPSCRWVEVIVGSEYSVSVEGLFSA